MRKQFVVAFFGSVFLLVAASCSSQNGAKDTKPPVPDACTSIPASELLGPEKSPNEFVLSLFDDYCAKVRRSPTQDVTAIIFEPCNTEDAETNETTLLSHELLERLLKAIDVIVPVGDLVQGGDLGAVTNLQLHLLDVHQDAVVERVIPVEVTSGAIEEPTAFSVKSATILPMRTVFGRLSESRHYQYDGADERLFRVKMDGSWYWYWAAEGNNPEKWSGQPAFMRVAGPID
jgi:hypothetical protein